MSLYELALSALFLALCGATAAILGHAQAPLVIHSTPLDVTFATTALIVPLAATYFALGEFMLYGRATGLYVGVAFLIFAGAQLTLGLIPTFNVHPDLTLGPYGWAVFRIVGGSLLVLASMVGDYQFSAFRRPRLTVVGIFSAVVMVSILASWMYTSQSSTLIKSIGTAEELVAALLFGMASFGFWRAYRKLRRAWFVWLAMSLCIAAFAQIQYAIHPHRAGYVQSGDMLQLVFFISIVLALAGEWSRNYRRLRWQARELEALHSLMHAPIVENVQALVQHIVQVVSHTFDLDVRITLAARDGQLVMDPLATQMAQIDPYAQEDADDSRRIVVGVDDGPYGRVALGVPLTAGGHRLGMLVVSGEPGAEFTTHDVRLLRAFGSQASVLLERALLYEEVAAGAVLAERSRLAREIHDGLAQHLAFLKMRVGWLRRSPAAVDADQLGDIEGVLETALIEARHAISTLRAQPEAASTADALRDYVEEFGQVSGLQAETVVATDTADVGPKARAEVLRIVQEALNNVRKHANATAVVVEIGSSRGGLDIVVGDNGLGFMVRGDREGHFGLEIMRERAESVGGVLTVDSNPGKGTEVHVWLPLGEARAELRAASG